MAMMRECSAGTTVPSQYPGSGSRRCRGATQTATIHVEFFPARWIVASAMSLGGCFFMRAIVLIDGQNLYHLARRAWASGHSSPYGWPSYDVGKLVRVLVSRTPGPHPCRDSFLHWSPRSGGWPFAIVLARLLVEQDQVSEEPRGLRLPG